jgi:rhodanese-related sulfurtransferase
VPTDLHDVEELRRLLDAGAQLVEVLPASAYEREHLPGAVNVPLTELREDRVGDLDRSRPVVAYCFDYQ